MKIEIDTKTIAEKMIEKAKARNEDKTLMDLLDLEWTNDLVDILEELYDLETNVNSDLDPYLVADETA